jgi:hypothetical protein
MRDRVQAIEDVKLDLVFGPGAGQIDAPVPFHE